MTIAASFRQPTWRTCAATAALMALTLVTGCSRQGVLPFRVENARAHVERLAATIGARPAGTAASAAARTYLIDQLRLFGFDVRVQEIDATRPDEGYTARVATSSPSGRASVPTPSPSSPTTIPGLKRRARSTMGLGWRWRWKRVACWRVVPSRVTRSSSC